MPGYGGEGASWSLSPEGWRSRGVLRLENLGSSPPGKLGLLVGLPPAPPHARMEVGVPGVAGVDPRREASLPREQEAEPRPADLLLEVRGLGRPSRPHFLQPRPTPCSPRVYGNSGLDGFSEIIRSLCPHLTPPAPRGTQARLPGRRREGREPFSGPPLPAPAPTQVRPLPQHFRFKFGFHGSEFPGSAFHLQGSS